MDISTVWTKSDIYTWIYPYIKEPHGDVIAVNCVNPYA